MDYETELIKWLLNLITALVMAFVGWLISIKAAEKIEVYKQKKAVDSLYIDIEILNDKLKATLKPYCISYLKLHNWDRISIIDLNILKYIPWNVSKDMGWNSLTKEQKLALTLLDDYLNTISIEYRNLFNIWEIQNEDHQSMKKMIAHHRTIISFLSASYILTLNFNIHRDKLVKESYMPSDLEPKKNVKRALNDIDVDITEDFIKDLVN